MRSEKNSKSIGHYPFNLDGGEATPSAYLPWICDAVKELGLLRLKIGLLASRQGNLFGGGAFFGNLRHSLELAV